MDTCTCQDHSDFIPPDPELNQVNIEVIPTQRCPICYTYGHTHRASCKYRNQGMTNHIPIQPKS